MKPTIILLLTLLTLTANAQLNKKNMPVKKTTTLLMPVVTPPPGTQPKTQSKPGDTQTALTDADYFLAGAVVTVSTGNDNKEPNSSTAFFYVRPRKSNGVAAYKLEDYASEIKVNQTADLRLDRSAALTSPQNSLQHFKQNGLSVVVAYCNRSFCTDAWKINSVTVTLEFKDANGNPAPAGYASKTISFPVSSGILGFIPGCNPFWAVNGTWCGFADQMQKMLLKTDEYLNPLPAKLLNWREDDVN